MSKYTAAFKIEFLRFLEYRSEFIAEFISIFIHLFIAIFFALAIYEKRTDLYGYSLSAFVTYTLLSSIIGKIIETNIHTVLQNHIKEGSLSAVLLKPISYNKYVLSSELSWKFHSLVYSVIIIGLLILLYLKIFTLQIIVYRIPIFLLAISISYFLNRSFKFIIGIFAFWTKDTRGISNFLEEFINIIGGSWVPFEFFGSIAKVLKILPFSYLYYFPIQILINTSLTTLNIVTVVGLEIVWTIIFSLLGLVLWKKGLKQYESIGI
jgi:ABC-2 type transport system permease protein